MSNIQVQLNPDVPPTGSDLGIVNAARKSFGKRSEYDSGGSIKDKDKRLLEFLARGMTADDFEGLFAELESEFNEFTHYNDEPKETIKELLWQWRNTPTHDTPFNHGFFSFEVKAPVFVRAQLVKHEYLIMSEYSRRYITDDIEFYEPDVWRGAAEDKKQGSSGVVNLEKVKGWYDAYEGTVNASDAIDITMESVLDLYKHLVEIGVAPEQARMVLPQSLMTAWTWSGTLGAFAKMCQLRLHKDAQLETQMVAQQVYEELKKQFPVAAPLLVEGVK